MADQKYTETALFISAIIAGTVLHQLVRNIEVDRFPLTVLGCVIAAEFLVACGLQSANDKYEGFWASHSLAWVFVSCAVVSLGMNILVYRAFFHPLNRFPGPFGAKLSKLWSLKKVVDSKIRWYEVVSQLHEQYGDFVRIGPRELVVFDTRILAPLFGTRAMKGPFYSALEKSLHTNQDDKFHKQRRKVWDTAFKETLADYGPSIEEFTDSLLARIDATLGKAVMINNLCIYYSYDVMSALAFGNPTRFIEGKSTEIARTILDNIQTGVDAIGLLLHVPWMLSIVETLSFVGPMKTFKSWSAEQVERRRKIKNPRPDIMGHLLAHTQNDKDGRALLNADSRVIIGAGSDTTASALAFLFVLLAHHSSYQAQLREEVDRAFNDKTYTCARPQPLLDGIINEALRLCPPVLFSSQRIVPKGGLRIGDVDIPADTVVSLGTFQLHHDERNFIQPNDFVPERWTSRPELIRNKAAFLPFSMGPYQCPGKAIAMMELRSVIARSVRGFSISSPEGTNFDYQEFISGIKDHFTAGIPKQELVFTRRELQC